MPYSKERIQDLARHYGLTIQELRELQTACVRACDGIDNPSVLEHLTHGAGRRLSVLIRAIENSFYILDPELTRPLERDALVDLQINLHAFLINIVGIFDNWAWCFCFRHNLADVLENQTNVDLFKRNLQSKLPAPLRDHLTQESTRTWHKRYLKNYRDALAHRIPPYIPPSRIDPSDADRYRALEAERTPCILAGNWERLEQIKVETEALEHPVFAFLHSYSVDSGPKPIVLHPQLLSDAMTVTEFGRKFMAHWHERA